MGINMNVRIPLNIAQRVLVTLKPPEYDFLFIVGLFFGKVPCIDRTNHLSLILECFLIHLSLECFSKDNAIINR